MDAPHDLDAPRVCSRRCRWLLLLAGVWGSTGPVSAAAVPPAEAELALNSKLRVRVVDGRRIELLVAPQPSDTYATLAQRLCGREALAPILAEWNAGTGLAADRPVVVPLALLSEEYRLLVLQNLFPEDRYAGEDWIHVARAGRLPTYNEGLWQVAEWFTGDGARFERLLAANSLSSPELAAGQEVRIPGALLLPGLRRRARSDDGSLEYGEDAQGPYAGYRLRAGEALYSAVVVRYTGRTRAEDVNELARELARRSAIDDLTDIPVGYLVKIPLEVLEPQFLPPDHPRRVAHEQARREMERVLAERAPVRARALEGVVVILDPGHGGRDLGTMNHGVWEHDYVYDVTCRLKHLLDTHSRAEVVLTLVDAETDCVPSTSDRLHANRQGTVRTHPPFLARNEADARIAVHLRWYLANSVYRRALKNGREQDRVVFLSLHADARHPSLRGLMVYVPGARFRAGPYGQTSGAYRRFREVREKPRVDLPYRTRLRAEAISRELAQRILRAFGEAGLPVQPNQPIRDRIIRGRRELLPAVLRGNEVPAAILVELVNLNNEEDAALLAQAAARERLARALFRALFGYFGETAPPSTVLDRSVPASYSLPAAG